MSDKNVIDALLMSDETKCKDCVFRVSRLIMPTEDEEGNLLDNQELGDQKVFVTHSCVLLDIDVGDHLVIECTKHKNEAESNENLLFKDFFSGKAFK
jgi:hypothetical protein